MKQKKKHQFKYGDPEKKAENPGAKEEKVINQTDDLKTVKRDFRNSALTILAFLIILLVFYYIQEKTELLGPVLEKINL